eukprot:CAMPEP_0175083380 /NCGR_PEP_ID=MMETSP0052_2-20121109/27349_1 /TAXON_ID=51329 ORGANISM="Polytomella parva, Strain SAG 63-3" /NCGR_SAMPLE_ID=MMETSP0052_2 /ASSEMBLY_ACC=CAM_ASM_000194 /LENGTH=540 /DNA_ID=CAMNT_0016354821 /DNA_START=166 /DNA_END=1785 /DNA_ORIENTATION=+
MFRSARKASSRRSVWSQAIVLVIVSVITAYTVWTCQNFVERSSWNFVSPAHSAVTSKISTTTSYTVTDATSDGTRDNTARKSLSPSLQSRSLEIDSSKNESSEEKAHEETTVARNESIPSLYETSESLSKNASETVELKLKDNITNASDVESKKNNSFAQPKSESESVINTTTPVPTTVSLPSAISWPITFPLPHQGRMEGSQLLRSSSAGLLLSWGVESLRLGRQAASAKTQSMPYPALPSLSVASISASRHSALSTALGSVWAFGSTDSKGGGGHGSTPLPFSGQLGRLNITQKPLPAAIDPNHHFVVQVASGRYHTLALTDQGVVLSFGLNDHGQLGRPAEHFDLESDGALSSAGESGLAVWPGDEWGAVEEKEEGKEKATKGRSLRNLGQRKRKSQERISQEKISQKRLLETTNPPSKKGCVLGHSCYSPTPAPVLFPKGTRIVGVSAGRYNNLAITAEGRLFVWGMDGCATSGVMPARQELWRTRLVKDGPLAREKVVATDSGYVFWIAATESGSVFTCSTGDDGYAATLEHAYE